MGIVIGHIHDLDPGGMIGLQRDPLPFFLLGLIPGLGQRGRADIKKTAMINLGAHLCRLVDMIMRILFLFIGAVFFLVDNDQPEILHRGENGGTRPHHKRDPAFSGLNPLRQIFGGIEFLVPSRHGIRKSALQLLNDRGDQRGLRHKKNDASSGLPCLLDGIQDQRPSLVSRLVMHKDRLWRMRSRGSVSLRRCQFKIFFPPQGRG